MRRYLLLSLLVSFLSLFAVHSQNISYRNSILSALDSLSYPEAKKMAVQILEERIELLGKFCEAHPKETFDREKERYEPQFILLETDTFKRICENYSQSLFLIPSESYGIYSYTMDSELLLPRPYVATNFFAKLVYFKDGSVSSGSFRFYNSRVANYPKPLDSIYIETEYRYPSKMSEYRIRKGDKYWVYNGIKIQIHAFDDNYIKLVVPNDIAGKILTIQGLNKDGKCLERSEFFQTPCPFPPKNKFMKKHLNQIHKLIEKIRKDKYPTLRKLRFAIDKQLQDDPFWYYLGGNVSQTYAYEGFVESAVIYIEEASVNQSVRKMLRNRQDVNASAPASVKKK